MTRVLILYYSSYGHVAAMAEAIAEGARAAGAEADVRRVPETAPAVVAARQEVGQPVGRGRNAG